MPALRNALLLMVVWLSGLDAFGQSVTTQAATGVTDVLATLRGSVIPGSTTNYRYPKFEYWIDGGLISTINADPFNVIGTSPVAVTANPPDLLPNTTYHYRVVMNPSIVGGGGWVGGEMTFTTAAPTTLPTFQSAYADIIGDTLVNFVIWNTRSGGSPATTTFEYIHTHALLIRFQQQTQGRRRWVTGHARRPEQHTPTVPFGGG